MRRPPLASFELEPLGEGGTVERPEVFEVREIQSALTTRRGTPSTRTRNSPGSRSGIERPRLSTTVTSIDVTSTPLRNCGRFCACAGVHTDKTRTKAGTERRNICCPRLRVQSNGSLFRD